MDIYWSSAKTCDVSLLWLCCVKGEFRKVATNHLPLAPSLLFILGLIATGATGQHEANKKRQRGRYSLCLEWNGFNLSDEERYSFAVVVVSRLV